MALATIFDIERNSFVDGPGIRTTVFFKGCNLRCAWCHNPESQSVTKEMLFYKNRCTGCGKCKEKCKNSLASCDLCGKCTLYCPSDAREICGKEYTPDEVVREIAKDKLFYENSGGGVTFSGGEPLMQAEALLPAIKALREAGFHVAIDTSGALDTPATRAVLDEADLILLDVKSPISTRFKEVTGLDIDATLSTFDYLRATQKPVWIRQVVAHGLNDTEAEKEATRAFIAGLNVQRIDRLPYHELGLHKYESLGIPYRGTSLTPPSPEELKL